MQIVKLMLLSKINIIHRENVWDWKKINEILLEGKPIKHNCVTETVSGMVFPFAVSPFSFSCFHPPAVTKVVITTPMLKLCWRSELSKADPEKRWLDLQAFWSPVWAVWFGSWLPLHRQQSELQHCQHRAKKTSPVCPPGQPAQRGSPENWPPARLAYDAS